MSKKPEQSYEMTQAKKALTIAKRNIQELEKKELSGACYMVMSKPGQYSYIQVTKVSDDLDHLDYIEITPRTDGFVLTQKRYMQRNPFLTLVSKGSRIKENVFTAQLIDAMQFMPQLRTMIRREHE